MYGQAYVPAHYVTLFGYPSCITFCCMCLQALRPFNRLSKPSLEALRYRAEDFHPLRHIGGVTPGWPIDYAAMEPFYTQAETLYRVRGDDAGDATVPPRSARYPYPPVPDEPDIAALRRAFAAQGLHPSALPLGVDIDAWLARAPTTWDAFPDSTGAKSDAESCGLAAALRHALGRLQSAA